MEAKAKTCQESLSFVLALNDRCPMVRAFGRLVRQWDKGAKFNFVHGCAPEGASSPGKELIQDLASSPWSILLMDSTGNRWFGPEAVPIILTQLPFGKVAAVFYILPGTMWLTRQTYRLLSRNRQYFNQTTKIA